jgi:CBS domain-containing protein
VEAKQMTKAKDIMKTNVLAVALDADIYEAIRIMVANNVTGLPVIDDDRLLVGIVTEKDVLTLLYNIEDRPGQVADFMTPAVVAFEQDTDLVIIAESLFKNHFRRVPILDQGKLVGIVSRKDIIRHIKEARLNIKVSV